MNEDKFAQLCTDVEVVKSKLMDFMKYVDEDMCKINDDHEKRIRSLEAFKFKIIGVVAASSVFGGIAGAIIQFLFK